MAKPNVFTPNPTIDMFGASFKQYPTHFQTSKHLLLDNSNIYVLSCQKGHIVSA